MQKVRAANITVYVIMPPPPPASSQNAPLPTHPAIPNSTRVDQVE